MKYLALIILAAAALTGCASLNHAGSASYSVKTSADGWEVTVNNGKEIAVVDAVVVKKGDDIEVRLHQEGVAAFEGQRIAAGALDESVAKAAKAAAAAAVAAVLPALAPAAGAALAAPGLPAAAVGAGAAIGVQKLTGDKKE